MNINFTVVVQLVNFFIAYVLIERLLMRPAAALIVQEDEERLKLQTIQTAHKEHLEQKELEKVRAWSELQALFAQKMPRIVFRPFVAKEVLLDPQQPDEQTVKQTIEKSTDFLVARVSHD